MEYQQCTLKYVTSISVLFLHMVSQTEVCGSIVEWDMMVSIEWLRLERALKFI